MTKDYKILAQFIKDMSSETPDVETYMHVKDNISKYNLGININSKALKSRMIEIDTAIRFEDKNENKKKSIFEFVCGRAAGMCVDPTLTIKCSMLFVAAVLVLSSPGCLLSTEAFRAEIESASLQ